jgi:hypothetical protein
MKPHIVAIVLAVLGAAAQLTGVVIIVREIAGDRDRARALLDKNRSWRPEKRPAPRRVMEQAVAYKQTNWSQFDGGEQGHNARNIASLVNAHNQLQHDVGSALDERTKALLEEVDSGDKELRDVLRELLRGSILERYVGVAAIGVGIVLSMAASIASSLPS